MSFSLRRRYLMRPATVMILRPCFWAYGTRSGTRAIVPSSFMISQITAVGFRPARRARSTPASVCPARSSTPPGRAMRGNTCPGCTSASGPDSGSMATWMVCARSAAEMPVVTPSRASTETVNAVCRRASLWAVIGGRFSSAQRCGVSVRQMRPRPSLAMKLMRSAVANCAAIVRSPSFSRSSSSQTMTILPSRRSSSASAMDAKCRSPCPPARFWSLLTSEPRFRQLLPGESFAGLAPGDERVHVLGDEIRLEIDPHARRKPPQRGDGRRVRDQGHTQTAAVDGRDREAHAVDRHRTLCDADVAHGLRRLELHDQRVVLRCDCLLYTSDAADDLLCVDLGGRRI